VLHFFGLTPEYKKQFYREIHDLVYYGKGGFIHSEVYNMPIHIRRYHIHLISETHKKQNEETDEANQSMKEANNKISGMRFRK
jgi:membrane-bound lytic murein transglycosylase MltF